MHQETLAYPYFKFNPPLYLSSTFPFLFFPVLSLPLVFSSLITLFPTKSSSSTSKISQYISSFFPLSSSITVQIQFFFFLPFSYFPLTLPNSSYLPRKLLVYRFNFTNFTYPLSIYHLPSMIQILKYSPPCYS